MKHRGLLVNVGSIDFYVARNHHNPITSLLMALNGALFKALKSFPRLFLMPKKRKKQGIISADT
jgi:hypothetical protein